MTPGIATAGLWVAWILSWMLASLWTRRTQARPPLGETLRFAIRPEHIHLFDAETGKRL